MMKNSRAFGFIIIALTYAAAVGVGAAVFFVCAELPLWLRLLLADIAATVVVYAVSCIARNASVYDPYWSVQPLVIVPVAAATVGACGISGALLIAATALWGVRLTANWAYTFKHLGVQDWRYDNIKRATGKLYFLVNFIGIQMIPTLVVFACQMPAIMYFEAIAPDSALCAFGIAVMLAATALELIADVQKHITRAHGGSGIISVGLWKHGRHPNYVGELAFWWGLYAAVVACVPTLWWTFFGAAANTLLFMCVSIPMAEKQSALRHGEEWKEYKNVTRLMI